MFQSRRPQKTWLVWIVDFGALFLDVRYGLFQGGGGEKGSVQRYAFSYL